MKSIFTNYKVLIYTLLASFLLTSCSQVGLLDDSIIHHINSIGGFIKVYIILQISILLLGSILGTFLDRLGYIISLVSHFLWIVLERDYGFVIVLLLFGLFTIISWLVSNFMALQKAKKEYDRNND